MSYKDFFSGKKITMLGLGVLGRGVGDAEFIAPLCNELLITDRQNARKLQASVEKLKRFPNITFRLGEQRKEDFIECDMVIKAAGAPLDSPYISAARKAGVPVYMSTALFAKFASEIGATILGVTGTRGKSTIAHMIHYVLIRANKRTVLGLHRAKGTVGPRAIDSLGLARTTLQRKVVLGGNIRGVSTLALLPEIRKGDVAVLELDSWQLQGFGDLKISPHIALFANLYADHQNYYFSMDSYFADKANIFRYQKTGDILLVEESIAEKIKAARPPVAPRVPTAIPSDWILKILGEHNRANAALAAAALRALGLSKEEIKNGLESFSGLEGRLQFVREVRGVKIYNDNNATTPEATIAALRALGTPEKKNIVLIIGGDDKKLDMSALVAEIPKWCSKVVLFKERGTDRIRDDVFRMDRLGIKVYEEEGLEATVNRSFKIAEPDEIILYSPAFSSFGKYFKNEFDRGDQFNALITPKATAS